MVDKAWCSYTISQARSIWKNINYPLPKQYASQVTIEIYHAEHEGIQGKMALKHAVDKLIENL